MNIVYPESTAVVAKTCGCNVDRQKVTYAFADEFHNICMDRKEIFRSEIEACERLLKYAKSDSERAVVEKEITELRIVLDLMP